MTSSESAVSQELKQSSESQQFGYGYGGDLLNFGVALERFVGHQYHLQKSYFEENQARIDESGIEFFLGQGYRMGKKKKSQVAYQVNLGISQINHKQRTPRYSSIVEEDYVNAQYQRGRIGITLIGRWFMGEVFALQGVARSQWSMFGEIEGTEESITPDREAFTITREMILNDQRLRYHLDLGFIVRVDNLSLSVSGLSSFAPYELGEFAELASQQVNLGLGVKL